MAREDAHPAVASLKKSEDAPIEPSPPNAQMLRIPFVSPCEYDINFFWR
jgi:hypothetical protein